MPRLSDDALFIGFDGSVMRGREQITSMHQEVSDRWMKGTRLVEEQTEVRFVARGLAIVHTLGGTLMRGKSKPTPERDSIQTLVAGQGRRWLVVRLVSEHPHPADRGRSGIRPVVAGARQALATPLPPLQDRGERPPGLAKRGNELVNDGGRAE